MPPVSGTSTTRRKDSRRLYTLSKHPVVGRFALFNNFQSVVSRIAPTTNFPKAKVFLPSNLWPWIWSYLSHVGPKVVFPTYANSGLRKSGLYPIKPAPGSDAIRLSIAGDWGTGTDEAALVADCMAGDHPDFTIHLGDVYFVGGVGEIAENCLGRPVNQYTPVKWPHGSQGSFALNGNHEMYADGEPYFYSFLPTLGLENDPEGQIASYFCLEADQWRVVAIDTGYNSTGVPILAAIPLLNKIPIIGGDCRLEPSIIDWLRTTVIPQDTKATLLLSHHQYFTAFPGEQNYPKPAAQLADFFHDQELVWIWGHEHRLAFYAKAATPGGFSFHGRCVGHSGMPVEMVEPHPSGAAPLMLYDKRTRQLDPDTKVGINGYVNATIQGSDLTLEYRDMDHKQIFVERFTRNPDHTLTRTVISDSGDLTHV